jgi:hypothetical protein
MACDLIFRMTIPTAVNLSAGVEIGYDYFNAEKRL